MFSSPGHRESSAGKPFALHLAHMGLMSCNLCGSLSTAKSGPSTKSGVSHEHSHKSSNPKPIPNQNKQPSKLTVYKNALRKIRKIMTNSIFNQVFEKMSST